jgi:hypothetical protein
MYGLSLLWHGLALNDLRELKMPMALYVVLSATVYIILGLGITFAMHQAIVYQWIGIRQGFPGKGLLLGAMLGFVVYLIALILGMSFTDSKVMHMLVDVLWQMVEQGMGGLMVSLGIIYDLHQNFLENERAR